MHPDLIASLFVVVGFGVLIAGTELWRGFGSPTPEQTRKVLHFGSCSICLPIVYIFQSPWSLLLLGTGFVGFCWLTKRVGWLPSMHGVSRLSLGCIYIPVSVYLCYLVAIATDAPEIYVLAILVLGISDALAAVVGKHYGRHTLRILGGSAKTVEGSAAFFVSAFFILGIGLMMLVGFAFIAAFAVAAGVSLLLTVVELVSLRGRDNLFVPIACMTILLPIIGG